MSASDGDSRSPRARNLAFRDRVLVVLHEAGVVAARRPSYDQSLPGANLRERGAVEGLPWVLTTHRQRVMKMSEALDQAAAQAERTERGWYATVFHRRDHSPEQAYVVLTLGTFAQVLAELHGDAAPALSAVR